MVRYGIHDSSSDEDDGDEIDLHSACAIGDLTLVRVFMGSCNCRALLDVCDTSGRTPLRVAVDHDQIQVAELLLQAVERNADDVNARDDRGWTPLASACAFSKNETMLSSLVQAGADLNWRDEDGSSLQDLAARNNNQVAISFLQRKRMLSSLTAEKTDEIDELHRNEDTLPNNSIVDKKRILREEERLEEFTPKSSKSVRVAANTATSPGAAAKKTSLAAAAKTATSLGSAAKTTTPLGAATKTTTSLGAAAKSASSLGTAAFLERSLESLHRGLSENLRKSADSENSIEKVRHQEPPNTPSGPGRKGNNSDGAICSICESSLVDVTLAPCQHRACDECSRRWKRCHVTLIGSICGIACGAEITGRWRKISAIVESINESEEAEGEVEAEASHERLIDG